MSAVTFTLSYDGAQARRHEIDFYDVSQALISFQRTIALTTHLILNDEIITQAPSLKGARIFATPPEPGSWKITAVVTLGLTGLFKVGTTENNSPIGHLIYSMYDYVISESLGFHVDYNKSLGSLYEEAKKQNPTIPVIENHQADSLMEKCSRAIEEMHRPIIKSETAKRCVITGDYGAFDEPLNIALDSSTYEFIHETFKANAPGVYEGRVSSYNANTFKGRIYITSLGRPIAFELDHAARTNLNIQLITTSLFHNALKQYSQKGSIVYIVAFEHTSKSGTLKSLSVSKVADDAIR